MEQLPDDVLVLVMQYLSVADILACRLVCKRFGGPSLYGQVWRHRRAVDGRCVCAVLRLAPCLEAVLCSGHSSALAATQCAVEELILVVDWQVSPARYARIVRSQEAFGRLKRVEVRYRGPFRAFAHGDDADALLTALVQCSGLESLLVLTEDVVRNAVLVRGPFKQGPSGSSLKIFKCALTRNSEYVVNTVLAGHAATLEEVELDGGCDCAPKTAHTLATLPKLRRLKCDMLPGLEAVAACKTLRDVTLCLTTEFYGEINVESVEGFLRQAKQLHAFSMDFTVIQIEDCNRVIDALASCGGSLKRLSATVIDNYDELSYLIRVLPSLPALTQLSISLDKDERMLNNSELLDITSTTAPALRRLELLEKPPSDPGDCHHQWLHGGEGNRDDEGFVNDIFAFHPLLHIHLLKPYACAYCYDCRKGCHQTAEWNEHSRIVLFAHDPGHCSSPEDHTADSTWRCIRIPCT